METMNKTKQGTITWTLDPMHSTVNFRVKHMMMTTVNGGFDKFEITASTPGEDFLQAEFTFQAETASINTGNAGRDEHLRSAEFFNSEAFPLMRFKPTKMEKAGDDGSFIMHGNLTIRDITKNVKLDVEHSGLVKDPWGNERVGFIVNGKINRKDWNLNWNVALETGGILVGEEVKINAEIQLIKGKEE